MKSGSLAEQQLSILFPEHPVKVLNRLKPSGRSRDSEGRFCSELDLPKTRSEYTEREYRRNESIYRQLRIKDEEIIKLKEELKKYKN
jgi:hypothetical protein